MRRRSMPSVCPQYALSCSCPGNPKYIGKTRVKIKTRMSQHRDDVASLQKNPAMSVSGVTKHAAECQQGTVDWDNPEDIATFQDNKAKTANDASL